MHTVYQIVAGPMVWAAFALFLGGMGVHLVQLVRRTRQNEPFVFTHMSWRYGLRSIMHWIVPFVAVNWRRRPVLTVVTFIFHISLAITPIFALAHIVLWEESWGVAWPALPDAAADVLTMVVMACCVFFAVRRSVRPEVRYVTEVSDYLLLVLTATPFVTGFLAYHQYAQGGWLTVAHIFSGELLLAAIPFTRLSHMLLAWFTRAYIGSEFGAVRHARDW